ncbi:hypothetical protein ACFP81_01020 [Deinococcus lacus]|uniref:Uncharacterized protein n=1 Tax=Deinococcus lacus TaxID=392561 RepID=A0ABW1Y936_9DEIO
MSMPAHSWLPLDDTPSAPLSPLRLSLLRREREGLAAQMTALLGLSDPRELGRRLVAQTSQTGQQAQLHAGRLDDLCAGLPPEWGRAVAGALGVPGLNVPLPPPQPWPVAYEPVRALALSAAETGEVPSPLLAKARFAVGERVRSVPTADALLTAGADLATPQAAAAALGAAYSLEALGGACAEWTGEPGSTAHLELLSGLQGGAGESLRSIAQAQVQSF